MPLKVANPFGFNNAALGQGMSNIAQAMFGGQTPVEAEEARMKTELMAAQLAQAKANADKTAIESRGLTTNQTALYDAADLARNGVDFNNSASRNDIASRMILAGKDGINNIGAGLHLSAGPDNENVARFLLPYVTGNNVGMDQFATTPGAEAGRAKLYAHEAAMNDADNAALLAKERISATTPKAPVPLDITPAEAIKMQDLIAYNLGAAPEDIDPVALNALTAAASRHYQTTRDAGSAVALALQENPVQTEKVGEWNPFVSNRTTVKLAQPPSVGNMLAGGSQPQRPKGAPYPDGTKLIGPGGGRFIVQGGVPVPLSQ